MKLRLRERLLIPIIALIMLGMGISIETSNRYAKKSISEITKKSMIQTVDNVTASLNSWIQKQDAIIATMSEMEIFKSISGDTERYSKALKLIKKVQKQHQEFDTLFISDLKGNLIISSKEEMIGKYNISDRKYFKETLKNKRVMSDVIINKHTKEVIFTINRPLVKDGKISGILSGIVKMDNFTQSIKNLKIGKTGYVFICNNKGTAIYHPDPKVVLKASLANYDWGRKMLENKKGYMEYKWGKTPTISVYQQSKETDWLIVSRVVPSEIFAPIAKLQKINIIIAAITIAALSLAIALLTRFIILKPVNLAVSFAQKISSGDLTARMELNQNDELGQLVASLNGMGDRLKEMFQVSALRKLVEKLTSDSGTLNEISSKMNKELEEAAGKSETVSHQSVEMAGNIKTVARALEDSSENMAAVAAGAEQMSSTIDEIAENTEKTSSVTRDAVERAKEASSRIDMLGQAAKEIGAVTVTIKDISDQTNLLALNATIEAARAGDAGKGFAVVASEIKDLASQTAAATADISTKIKNIQGSTDETVIDINEIGSTINDIDQFVTSIATAIEEQSATTKEIAESVNQASANISDVNSSTGHSADSASKITEDISGISNITKELMDGSSKVNQSSQELEKLASQVRELVSQFKI